MIQMKAVSKRYIQSAADEWALRDVTVSISEGEMVAIVGTSGSGKTTLLNLIGGLDRGFEGEVSVAGSALSSLSDRALSQLRNQKIGFVFQHFNLLDHLTAIDNVCLPVCLTGGGEIHFEEAAQDPQERAISLLKKLGLGDKLNARPTHLSGGQKQRVAIARALFFNPPLLLCDEPTGSLDTHTGQTIIELFKSLHQEGYTVVMITHEDRVSREAHRIIRLEDGYLISDERVVPHDGETDDRASKSTTVESDS